MIRAVQASGGFATVLQSGDRDSGVILVVTCEKGRDSVLYERVPDLETGRRWVITRRSESEELSEFNDFLQLRRKSDPDCWVIELDIANAARFVPGFTSQDG